MFRTDILEVTMDNNILLPLRTKAIQPSKLIRTNPLPQCTTKNKRNTWLSLRLLLVVAMVTVRKVPRKRVRPVLATQMWSMSVRPSLLGTNKMVDDRMNSEVGPSKALILWRKEKKK